jgi:hypothetical protein
MKIKSALSLRNVLAVIVALVVAQGIAAQTAVDSETRIALVVGNGAYANVPLKNPVNDARDLAAALKGLGFSVTLVIDGDLPAMSRAIRDFGNAIKRPDAVALFYYSGHGVQYHGANYLIPAKSDIRDADELSFSAVNADLVYAKMESSGDKTNIVILDACRNNPFPGAERASERGLAIVSSVQPPQSFIVYATAPGKTAQDGEGRNGVFTTALLKHIADPMLDVELMMRRVREEVVKATAGVQVPWNNSSISGAGFAFAGKGRLLVSTDPPGAEVFVDGQMRGLSPISLADLPRYSEIEVSARSGTASAARRITLTDASEAKMQLSLQAARGSIPVAPAPAAAPTPATPPASTKSTGTITLTSEPPGVEVIIDGGDTATTPVSLELAPGAHSFEPKKAFLYQKYYAAQPLQWITVTAGSEVNVPIRLKPETGKLALKLVPDGYTVFVDNEDMGVTPLSQIDVKAGVLAVHFEKGSEKTRNQYIGVSPNATISITWGGSKETAITLPRQTISLDGKPDSWADIPPIYETSKGSFMGSKEYGIQRFFICRDDKYLYWRVDFFETNPLLKIPPSSKGGVALLIGVSRFDPTRDFNMIVQYSRMQNMTQSSLHIWDDAIRKDIDLKDTSLSWKYGPTMIVTRLEIAKVLKYCRSPLEIHYMLSAMDERWNWLRTEQSTFGWVDFSK